MAINSLWQQYLRVEEYPDYGSECWNAWYGTNFFLIDVKEVEEDKNGATGKTVKWARGTTNHW